MENNNITNKDINNKNNKIGNMLINKPTKDIEDKILELNSSKSLYDKKFYFDKFIDLKKKTNISNIENNFRIEVDNLKLNNAFNMWSLSIVKKWLSNFYGNKFWNSIALEMTKYDAKLSSDNIELKICSDFKYGYYLENKNKIILCSNLLTNYNKSDLFETVLKRLLVFMLDRYRFSQYSSKNCYHLACSEVRASNLTGLCDNAYKIRYSFSNRYKNEEINKDCVRQKSIENLMHYFKNCKDEAVEYVDGVINKCINDSVPINNMRGKQIFIKSLL